MWVCMGSFILSALLTATVSQAVGLEQAFRALGRVDVTGLLAFAGLAVGVGIQSSGSRRYKAMAFSFGFMMALGHMFAVMAPDEVHGYHLPILSLILFFPSLVAMCVSCLFTFRAHIDEGEGEAIPFPTRKIDGEP